MSNLTFPFPSWPSCPSQRLQRKSLRRMRLCRRAGTANSQCRAALCRAAQQTGRSQRRATTESLKATRAQGQDYPAAAAFIPGFRRPRGAPKLSPQQVLSCYHEIACTLGDGNCSGVDHRLRDLRYHRSVNDAQSRYAFNAKGLIDDRPDTAGANRVVKRVCRLENEVAQIRGAHRAGAGIDLLSPPIGKGGPLHRFRGRAWHLARGHRGQQVRRGNLDRSEPGPGGR